jgi:hypothetical protein
MISPWDAAGRLPPRKITSRQNVLHKPSRAPALQRVRQIGYVPGDDRQHVRLKIAALLDQSPDRRDIGLAVNIPARRIDE